jgi:hypothetical protein
MSNYYARLAGSVVVETVNLPSGTTLEDAFHADLVAQMVPCDSSVEQGDIYANGRFTKSASLPPSNEELAAHANSKAGVLLAAARTYVVGGVAVKADATSGTVADLLALQQWGLANSSLSSNWLDNAGVVTPLTGAQFVELALLVGPYRMAVFNALGAVMQAINNRTIATLAQIDSAPWPV